MRACRARAGGARISRSRARAGRRGAPPRDIPTVGWRMPNRLKITSRATTGDPRVAAIIHANLNPKFFLTPRGSASRPRANGFFHLGVHLGFAWTLNRARSVRECGAAPPAAAHPLGRGRGRGAAAADLACACDAVRPAAEASPPARPRATVFTCFLETSAPTANCANSWALLHARGGGRRQRRPGSCSLERAAGRAHKRSEEATCASGDAASDPTSSARRLADAARTRVPRPRPHQPGIQ